MNRKSSFNLGIENLLISRREVRSNKWNPEPCRFNLGIENLLISSGCITHRVCEPLACFNLGIENLLISRCRHSTGVVMFCYSFNLVIENLLISSGFTNRFVCHSATLFQSQNRESSNFKRRMKNTTNRTEIEFQSRNRESSNFKFNLSR